jgi:hypothetical protein
VTGGSDGYRAGGEDDDMEIRDFLDERKATYERILQDLIEMPPARFDEQLGTTLPRAQGLYAISMIGAPGGEYLHVGKTASGVNGLWGRVWEQHYQTGGSPGDLIEKVMAKGYGGNRGEAQEYIRQNCQVQWVEEEDEALRGWAEHYLLAVLVPIWCS